MHLQLHRLLLNWVLISLYLSVVVNSFTWPWSSDDGDDGDDSSDDNSGDSQDDDDRNPYQPYYTSCPSSNLLREARNISQEEYEYVQARHEITNENLAEFLEDVAQLNDFNATEFIQEYSELHNISIGLAFSGGGYRAMLSGGGQVLALDSRYGDSVSKGLGGILQSATYISGLSGGSWMVGTMAMNNWLGIDDIISRKSELWDLEDSIFNPNGINLFRTGQYYLNIGTSLTSKDENYETTITDIWGRAIGYQLMDFSGGQNLTWSGIRDMQTFKDNEMPYPIVLANGRSPGTMIVDLNSTVYEFTPYEFGSWDPSVNAFIDTKYVGSYLDNGEPNSTDKCTVNFDNAGFVMGTSSSLFNQFLTRLDDYDINAFLKRIVSNLLTMVYRGEDDIALYQPNPFYNSEHGNSESIISNNSLYLVDGGEDQQNIPLHPLIQSKRDVDVIFAFDNSGDTETNWPNGSSIIHTFLRQFGEQGKGSPVPFVPTNVDAFLDSKAADSPVFFGCNASNLESLVTLHGNKNINSTDIPLIIHIPNKNYSYYSNTSTFKLTYEIEETLGMIENGFEVASRNNYTADRKWPTCVGCAIIRRTQERFNLEQSEECKNCFKEYCWEPDKNNTIYATVSSLAESIASATKDSDSSSKTKDSDSSSTTKALTTGSISQSSSVSTDGALVAVSSPTDSSSATSTSSTEESSSDYGIATESSNLIMFFSMLMYWLV